jgi:hypothetical protein
LGVGAQLLLGTLETSPREALKLLNVDKPHVIGARLDQSMRFEHR